MLLYSSLCLYAIVRPAVAHGYVSQYVLGGQTQLGWDSLIDTWADPKPVRIERCVCRLDRAPAHRPTPGSQGPCKDVTAACIACSEGSDGPTQTISQTVAAGSTVEITWSGTQGSSGGWLKDHVGPIIILMADCGGDCSTFTATTPNVWSKIDAAGLSSSGQWATDYFISKGSTWTFKLPSELKAGKYLLHMTILALHSASTVNGAQWYPTCASIEVTGDGAQALSNLFSLPGAYSATDPGVKLSIYWPIPTSYIIPGPAVSCSDCAVDSIGFESAGSSSNSTTSASTASSVTPSSSNEASESTAPSITTQPSSYADQSAYLSGAAVRSAHLSLLFLSLVAIAL